MLFRSGPFVKDGIETSVNTKYCSDGITVFGSGLVIADNVKIVANSMIYPIDEGETSDIVVKSSTIGVI